jgi:predicted metal-dependent hydrolase
MITIVDFKREVMEWSEEIGVKPKEIQIRAMKRKWASCTKKGRLSFSYALLNEPYNFRSMVIVHELLHLKYSRHTKFFYLLVRAYLAKKGIEDVVIKS